MEIDKALSLSTAHIQRETSDLMEQEEVEALGCISWDNLRYGYIVYARTGDIDEMPEGLAQCVAVARALGCRYIMFDNAVDADDDLKTWEW